MADSQYWQIRNFAEAHQDDPDFMIKTFKFRQHLNRDTIIIIVGQKRSGKSYDAIKIAESLEPNWNIEHGLFFKTKPFLEEFRNATDRTFVLDEVSLSYSAQEWYSVENKIFNALVTSQGFRRNTLILTLPVLSHLDKKSISLAHYLLVTYNVGLLKWYKINNFYVMGKTGFEPKTWVTMGLPSQKSIDDYEKMKINFNNEKLDSDISTLEIMDHPEKYYGKKLPYDYYLKMFSTGIIDEEDLKQNLIEAGYKVADIEKLVELQIKMQKIEQQKEKEDFINSITDKKTGEQIFPIQI